MCQESASLGYSPMPINLVQEAVDGHRRIVTVRGVGFRCVTDEHPEPATDGASEPRLDAILTVTPENLTPA